MDVIAKVRATIKKHSMLQTGERVLVGLSAGPDSTCLLMSLVTLATEYGIALDAVYVDHGLRPAEIPDEITFCKDLCEELGVGFAVRRADVKGAVEREGTNKQETARDLRYAIFEEHAREIKAHRIALGHTLDDQAETFIMHIIRGTGLKGLGGIPPVRGAIIRPMIEVEKREIIAMLEAEGAAYMVDSSNLGEDYLRNRLRSHLMPMLQEMNPNIVPTMGHTAEILRDEDRYLEYTVNKTMMRLITRKSARSIELFSSPMETLDRVIVRRVLRRAVEATEGLRALGYVHIEEVIKLVHEGKAGDRVYLPHDIRAIKKYSTLLITSEEPLSLGHYTLAAPGEQVFLKEAALMLRAEVSDSPVEDETEDSFRMIFDAEKAALPITIRPRAEGDHFCPKGFGGKKKKLQDLFVDEKVPRDERDAVPVVTSGGEIIWVVGMRSDERFRVTPETKRFLILELKQARG